MLPQHRHIVGVHWIVNLSMSNTSAQDSLRDTTPNCCRGAPDLPQNTSAALLNPSAPRGESGTGHSTCFASSCRVIASSPTGRGERSSSRTAQPTDQSSSEHPKCRRNLSQQAQPTGPTQTSPRHLYRKDNWRTKESGGAAKLMRTRQYTQSAADMTRHALTLVSWTQSADVMYSYCEAGTEWLSVCISSPAPVSNDRPYVRVPHFIYSYEKHPRWPASSHGPSFPPSRTPGVKKRCSF